MADPTTTVTPAITGIIAMVPPQDRPHQDSNLTTQVEQVATTAQSRVDKMSKPCWIFLVLLFLCFQSLRVPTQATDSKRTTLNISSTQAAGLLTTRAAGFGPAWAPEAYWDICSAGRGQRRDPHQVLEMWCFVRTEFASHECCVFCCYRSQPFGGYSHHGDHGNTANYATRPSSSSGSRTASGVHSLMLHRKINTYTSSVNIVGS